MPRVIEWIAEPHKKAESDDEKAWQAHAKMILAKKEPKGLLKMEKPLPGWTAGPITADDIAWFANLMPATSGKPLELPKPKKKEEED